MRSTATRINELIDYILLNAYAMDTSGLSGGKAGISFVLIEASEKLHNNYFADKGTELLMQSILSKTDNIGFFDGLSGIGYVLMLLKKNNLLEFNFNEIFGTQHRLIYLSLLHQVNDIKKNCQIENVFRCCFYLNLFHSKKEQQLTQKIFDITISMIFKQMRNISKSQQGNVHKIEFVKFMTEFAKYIFFFGCYSKETSKLFTKYTELYGDGYLAQNSTFAYYSGQNISESYKQELRNILEVCTFNQIMDYLSVYLDLFPQEGKTIVHHLFVDNDIDQLGKWLFSICPCGFAKISYGFGISRLILLLLRILDDDKTSSKTKIV